MQQMRRMWDDIAGQRVGDVIGVDDVEQVAMVLRCDKETADTLLRLRLPHQHQRFSPWVDGVSQMLGIDQQQLAMLFLFGGRGQSDAA